MKSKLAAAVVALGVFAAGPAFAWGEVGHKVVALIAWKHLDPAVRATVAALLAAAKDTLTLPDFAGRARWGNCIPRDDGPGQKRNLHGFWDTGAVKDLGPTPEAIADKLDGEITPEQADAWVKGGPVDWATASFRLA